MRNIHKNRFYIQKIISENLTTYRQAANLTTKMLAERTFTTEEEIKNLENQFDKTGEAVSNFPLLVAVTEALKIRLEDLFESNDEYIRKYMVPFYFYQLFEKVRNEKSISQRQFYKIVGIENIEYYNWKTGRKYPAIEKIQNMLTLLNIKSTDLKKFENEYQKQHTKEEITFQGQNRTIKKSPKTVKTENVNQPENEKETKSEPEPVPEPIQVISKAYNLYKDIEKHIKELDNIIQSAERLKEVLTSYSK